VGLSFLSCARTRPICIRGCSELTLLRIFVISLCLKSNDGDCVHIGPLTHTHTHTHTYIYIYFKCIIFFSTIAFSK
jgi:hypothetical protein